MNNHYTYSANLYRHAYETPAPILHNCPYLSLRFSFPLQRISHTHTMTHRPFFDGWVGKIIDFPQLGTMSRWRLVTKLGDLNDQESALDYLEWQAPSGAYGTFRCRNVDHPDELAVVKIFVQSVLRLHEHMTGSTQLASYIRIPYAGSDFAIHGERARQATDSLTPFGRDQINALTTLTENNCSSTPTLVAKREFKQDSTGPVPGGFMVYLLMQHHPGVQLNKRVFWNLEPSERQQMREAFKEALTYVCTFLFNLSPSGPQDSKITFWVYSECIDCGIWPTLSKLHWDKSLGKV